jgi:hypothetical protein
MSTLTASGATPARSHRERFGLASWVEVKEERCRRGRRYTVAVNHRDAVAFALPDADAADGAVRAELRELGFLPERPAHLDAVTAPTRAQRVRDSLRTLDVCSRRADAVVRRWYERGLRSAFVPAAFGLQALVAIGGVVVLVSLLGREAGAGLRVSAAHLPVVIALGLVAGLVHELGHALVLVHQGRHVRGIGLRLHLGSPSFYVESLDGLLLDRRHRLLHVAAGPWAEWVFTSVVALCLAPFSGAFVTAVLYRFVVVNAVTVASNLLPVGGLDGQWLFADAVREPDLPLRSRAAPRRVAQFLVARHRVCREDVFLAAYAVVNVFVSAALVVVACFLWYQLFASMVGRLVTAGVAGWLGLAGFIAVVSAPLGAAGGPVLRRCSHTVARWSVDRVGALRFRLERRWRVAATLALRRLPELANADAAALGVVAGELRRVRLRRGERTALTGPAAVLLRAGDVVFGADRGEQPLTLATLERGRSLAVRARRSSVLVLWPDAMPATCSP